MDPEIPRDTPGVHLGSVGSAFVLTFEIMAILNIKEVSRNRKLSNRG